MKIIFLIILNFTFALAKDAEQTSTSFYGRSELRGSLLKARDVSPNSKLDFSGLNQELLIETGKQCTRSLEENDSSGFFCYFCLKSKASEPLTIPHEKFLISAVSESTVDDKHRGTNKNEKQVVYSIKTQKETSLDFICRARNPSDMRNSFYAHKVQAILSVFGADFNVLKPEEAKFQDADDSTNTVTKKEKIFKRAPTSKK